MVVICSPFHQEHLAPSPASSHQVNLQCFHPTPQAAVSQPKVQDAKASKLKMSTTHHTSPQMSISEVSRIAEFISNSQKDGTEVYMEDYFMQLANAGYSLETREYLKQEISLKIRADKASREPAELLTVEADKKPAKELSEKAELMEVPKTLVWETKTEVPVKEELENKDENSVFVKRKIKFEEKTEESVNDDTASSNDNPNDGQANHGAAKDEG